MKQIGGRKKSISRRQIAFALLLTGLLVATQFSAISTMASSYPGWKYLQPWILSDNEGPADHVSTASNLANDFEVGQVGSILFYRINFATPTPIEYCTAITNGSYAQLSLSPTGPFSSGVIQNIPFYADSSGPYGYGSTPSIYVKGIAPINGLAVSLSCPISIVPVAYINVVPAPQPTPTPTPSGTPMINVEPPNGFEPTLALTAQKGHKVTLTGLTPSTGSLRVSDTSQNFTFRLSDTTTFSNPLVVPVQADSSGFAEVMIHVKAIKASGASKPIEFKYTSSQGTSLTRIVSLTAINVQSVWYERDAGQVPIDNNPHIGGGLRVFPEKKTPTDTSSGRGTVTVKARVYPAVAGQKVSFRIYDVDDPEFVSLHDINGALDVDPNGISGNDNRGESAFVSTHNQIVSVNTDAGGVASAIVNVSPQPGDNIRIGAAAHGVTYTNYVLGATMSSIALKTIDVPLPSGTTTTAKIGLVDTNGNLITETGGNTAVAVATKMLTTWRRLHLEVDSMGPVTNNFLEANILNTTAVPGGFGTLILIDKSMENNRFANGRVEITQHGVTTSYKVASSGPKTINVNANLTDALIGESVKLFDDDDMNGSDPTKVDGDYREDVPSPDLGWLQDVDQYIDNSLMIVYVRPTYDLTGSQNDLPFYLNAPKADLAAGDSTIAEKTVMTRFNNEATRNDEEYWTGYILGAYQVFHQGDMDPTGDSTSNNVSSFMGETAEFGSIIYLETVSEMSGHKDLQYGDPGYDVFFNWKETPFHEVLHLLNADDGDGGQIDCQYDGLSGKTQDKVRRTRLTYMGNTP